MEVFIKIVQLLLSLSLLVLLHEFGHFIAARIFKTRVEKFYLFFNPWFSIYKFKRGETTYGLGWLPLGGYVKIAGMIDESMDKKQMKNEPQPWEFRSKPAWQRLIIMIGGVVMNLILAFIIYIFLLFIYGQQYLPVSSIKNGIACDSTAMQMGLQNGDHILKLDGKNVDNFMAIPADILLNNTTTITVERNGKILDIPISDDIHTKLLREKNFGFITPRFPTIIEDYSEYSIAKEAGLLPGDTLIAVNDIATPFYNDFKQTIIENTDQAVTITALRGGDTLGIDLTVPNTGVIGIIVVTDMSQFFELRTKEYSFFQAVPAGIKFTYDRTTDYLKQLKIIFSPKTKAYESLGGFISIGNLFPGQWDWYSFWNMTAFISIILAIMNLLPIPALDGGHVLFLLWEIITRRKPHDKFIEYAQIAGMVFLLLLVLYANGSDIFRLFK
jgi:regulator of sigma E protease